MAATEGDVSALDLPVVELCERHVAGALDLSRAAGWNQTAADWLLMIRCGRAFGVAAPDGGLVATALALPYPPGFGWVSMVLVHAAWQRRGLGTLLLSRVVDELRERGLVPFLDATPAGRALYEPLGFRAVEPITRWRGAGHGGNGGSLPQVPEAAAIAELDRAAFGADRSAILADLLAREGALSLIDPGGRGFLLTRPGRAATQLGPVVASGECAALDLVAGALDGIAGPALIDVPDREDGLSDLLRERGFEPERPFTRMALGRDTAFGEQALVRAIAGPELG
ncbi:MAG: GNAT family N-acetyltransferase [Thermoleophilia bacterium]|nr:GNAT family N-acetyltransferase [Thermoleophilia bacterium]